MKKQPSTHALCAKAIKKEILSLYPNIKKLSVKSSSFSGGDDVRVDYLRNELSDPDSNVIQELIDKYQYGSFNGMEDIYEITNDRSDLPQVKYVFAQCSYSKELLTFFMNEHNKKWEHKIILKESEYSCWLEWETEKGRLYFSGRSPLLFCIEDLKNQ